MRSSKFVKPFLVVLAITFVLSVWGIGALRWWMQSSVDELAATAQESHPDQGDDVAALIAYVESDSHDISDKNRAVWALGQLRDGRALPVLQQFFTGEECNHAQGLCQDELKKAIKLCEGKTPNLLKVQADQ
ncbi:hypothetical protein ACFL1X_01255 [Candidatus Hydrogenedentota bacterium]